MNILLLLLKIIQLLIFIWKCKTIWHIRLAENNVSTWVFCICVNSSPMNRARPKDPIYRSQRLIPFCRVIAVYWLLAHRCRVHRFFEHTQSHYKSIYLSRIYCLGTIVCARWWCRWQRCTHKESTREYLKCRWTKQLIMSVVDKC